MVSKVNYEELVNDAFVGMIRRLLERLRDGGFERDPPALYITFKTKFQGVEMPESLRQKFPSDITIVLQHQFENLKVEEDHFSVVLSFSGKKEFLRVPYNAMSNFYDMNANFNLRLTPKEKERPKEEPAEGKIISLMDLKRKKP